MPSPIEDVVVTADGQPCPYVKEVTVAISAEKGVRSATVTVAEPDGRFWFPPGTAVVIRANGTTVLTGYARDYDADYGEGGRDVRVEIESKTCDVAECGTKHKTGRVEKKNLQRAATELGQGFGTKFRSEGGAGEAIPEVVVQPGESLFDTVERYARSQGRYITDDERGNHVLFKGIRGRHAGVLSLPGNVLKGSAKLSERTRKSERRVRGQSSRGWGKKKFRQEGVIRDAKVKRHRPEIIQHEGEADASRLKARAKYDQTRAAGFAIRASATVPGWRDEGGRIWTPAYVIPFDAWESLRVSQDMAIASMRLAWAKGKGSIATLELRDPRAFAEKGKGGKGRAKGKKSGAKASPKSSGALKSGAGAKSGASGASRADPAWDMPDEEPTLEVEE